MKRINKIIYHPLFVNQMDRLTDLESERIFCRHDLQHLLDVARLMWIDVLEHEIPIDELLDVLHTIEKAAKRERLIHWGPRTLDLDILLYDDIVQDDCHLTIPHPDMHNRDFVLKPMTELAPHVVHPLLRKTMQQLLRTLENK